MLTIVPIRSFASAMMRLAEVLPPDERLGLARRLASHVIETAIRCGPVAVVTASPEVADFARRRGVAVVPEATGEGLDGAADTGARHAEAHGLGWMIVHADLPLLGVADLAAAHRLAGGGHIVLSPSHDGGTSLFAGWGSPAGFAYGAGSFRRHLAARPDARILVRPGLALDVDRAADLDLVETALAVG